MRCGAAEPLVAFDLDEGGVLLPDLPPGRRLSPGGALALLRRILGGELNAALAADAGRDHEVTVLATRAMEHHLERAPAGRRAPRTPLSFVASPSAGVSPLRLGGTTRTRQDLHGPCRSVALTATSAHGPCKRSRFGGAAEGSDQKAGLDREQPVTSLSVASAAEVGWARGGARSRS